MRSAPFLVLAALVAGAVPAQANAAPIASALVTDGGIVLGERVVSDGLPGRAAPASRNGPKPQASRAARPRVHP